MKKDFLEKTIINCYFAIYDNLTEQEKLEIKHLKNQIEYYVEMQELKEEEKPLSFFKHKYSKWLCEMEEIDEKISFLYQELNKLYLKYFEKYK